MRPTKTLSKVPVVSLEPSEVLLLIIVGVVVSFDQQCPCCVTEDAPVPRLSRLPVIVALDVDTLSTVPVVTTGKPADNVVNGKILAP